MPNRTLTPYPPRPKRPPLCEPSVDWRVRLFVALLGARRATPPRFMRWLALSGLPAEEISRTLSRIRTTEQWWRCWAEEAERSAVAEKWTHASAQAYLAQLVLSPFHPQKTQLQGKMRGWHQQARSIHPGLTFQTKQLAGGRIAAYVETPQEATKPPVLLLPPLASIKEELTSLGDTLLAAGHPVIRLDLPAQGESPGALPLNAERLLSEALGELGIQKLFVGGISLGAFFALRLAGTDSRVLGAFGVSPPAITTLEDWQRQPEVIWQYLDCYFDTATRADTYTQACGLTLAELAPTITCPVLLFHGRYDRISPPEAPARYRELLTEARLTEQMVEDGHACLSHLRDPIAPEVAKWACEVMR
jgi:pimeloyl-ACP methyl ester carboxylesterase